MTEEQLHIVQEINTGDLCSIISSRNSSLEDEIRRLKNENKLLGERCNQLLADKGKLTDENTELKVRIGLSIECEKAQKNGELCLGYAADEDEPCEQCKNCIKCKCGYYQLGETEKDEQLSKLTDELDKWKAEWNDQVIKANEEGFERTKQTIQISKAKQFIRDFLSVAIDYIDKEDKNYSYIEEGWQFLKDSEVEK